MDYLFYIIILIVFFLIITHKDDICRVEKVKIKKESNIIEIFKDTVDSMPNHIALKYYKGNTWYNVPYSKYYEHCCKFMNGLKYHRVGIKSRICIIGHNAPEWFYAHIGSMMNGSIPVGVYPTSQEKTCEYIINNCKPRVLVLSDFDQLEKFKDVLNAENLTKTKLMVAEEAATYDNDSYLNEINSFYDKSLSTDILEDNIKLLNSKKSSVRCIILYDVDKLDKNDYNEHIKMYTWKQFVNLSTNINKPIMIDNKDVATIVYTSGTTGSNSEQINQKGVILTHNNIKSAVYMLVDKFGNIIEKGKERSISYLPLNHIAAQMMDIYLPISMASTVWFADKMALKGTLINTMKLSKPTIFIGVPRIWEKIYESIESNRQKMSYIKEFFIDFANSITNIPNIILINSLGLGSCKYRGTMAAPLSQDIKNYYKDIHMPIYEIYGMTETTGPISVCIPYECKYKSVGKPLFNTDIKIQKDGEIIVKGPSVFTKYYKNNINPLDNNGYYHTGDLGHIDNDDYLFITGRKKELIITAGGENILPVEIEDNIKKCLPHLLSYVIVVGDNRKFLSVLLVLKMDGDKDGNSSILFSKQTKELLKSIGSKCSNIINAEDDPVIKKYIDDGIKCANNLAVSNTHRIQKWKIIPNSFSINTGELTPTMKIRRGFIYNKYKDLIEQMYQ